MAVCNLQLAPDSTSYYLRCEDEPDGGAVLTLVRKSNNNSEFKFLTTLRIPSLQRENLAIFLCPQLSSTSIKLT